MAAIGWVTIELPMKSGVTADKVMNTFHVQWEGTSPVNPGDTEWAQLSSRFQAFYDTNKGALSADIDSQNLLMKCYLRSDPLPRVPRYEATIGYTQQVSPQADLPHELAICLSFQGARSPGLNQRRNRGRLFIGPLQADTLVSTGGGQDAGQSGFVASLTMQNLVTAGHNLWTQCKAAGWEWGIWSPTDNAFRTIHEIWCDNAFDIQRRRGESPTAYESVTVP